MRTDQDQDDDDGEDSVSEFGDEYYKYLQIEKFVTTWRVGLADDAARSPQSYSPEYFQKNVFPSQPFNVGEHTWRLQFNQHHWANEVRYVSLYLWLLKKPGFVSKVETFYQFDILDSDGNVLVGKKSGMRTFKSGDCYGWQEFAPYGALTNHLEAGQFLIRFQMEAMRLINQDELDPPPPKAQTHDLKVNDQAPRSGVADEENLAPTAPKRPKLISKPVRKEMRDQGFTGSTDSPVQVFCGNKIFRTNKHVLEAGAPKLASLVVTEEGVEKLELMEDDPVSVSGILEYLYSNKTAFLGTGAPWRKQLDLCRLAIKYEVKELAQQAFVNLSKFPAAESWAEVLSLYQEREAELGSITNLDTFKDFFYGNRKEITKTAKFQDFLQQYPDYFFQSLILK